MMCTNFIAVAWIVPLAAISRWQARNGDSKLQVIHAAGSSVSYSLH